MKNNVILEKSYALALIVIPVCLSLQREQREFMLSRQLMRAGTSSGANVEEAQAAQSRPDFLNKMCIAAKEARETHYGLRLIRDSKLLSARQLAATLSLATEVKRILTSIVKSTGEA